MSLPDQPDAGLLADSASQSRRPSSNAHAPGGFGTFGGVFTPCTLTILGVIMFLRFGYVVGNAGLINALIILAAAKLITTLTTLSLSAVATNTQVRGGGAYFLISRSLGVEFGGAIGIVFFLAQAISVAMYVIGFTEAVVAIFGDDSPFKLIALVTNTVVFVCVYIGAGWTIRVQYFILATLVLSLVSFFVGGAEMFSTSMLQENLYPHYQVDENTGIRETMFTMFALFFPAVTGIMAGANMSGDLKNPSRSIPRGTLWSIIVTAIIYTAMAVVLAGSQSAESLIGSNMVVGEVSRWPVLITAGVFAATLSSALGSMMGAPRILQALARDQIFPRLNLFSAGSGIAQEPRRAVILTFLLSSFCIVVADLNTIAPLITMAFMITYGTINIATFYEAITKNPSYRPTFRYSHYLTSLAGAIGCIAVMLMMNWQWAVMAGGMMAAIWYFLYRKQMDADWGDLSSGLMFERTRKNLLKLEQSLYHPKNWRPIILAMSGGTNRIYLSRLGHWLANRNGILNIGQVILGDVEDRIDRVANQELLLEKFIVEQQLDAFPNIVAAPTLSEGIEYLAQCSGLGALRPNTLLMGWPDETIKAEPLIGTMRVVQRLGRNLAVARILDLDSDPAEVPDGTIDVWWRGQKNGELMLLLAHLLQQNPIWKSHPIRLMRVIPSEEGVEEVLRHLNSLADSSRIAVEAEVFVSNHPQQVIIEQSAGAAMTLLGFELPEAGRESEFYQQMDMLTGRIARTLLISSIGNMKLAS